MARGRRTVLIVDGYNIINAWPELQRLQEVSLETARQALVEIMINFSGFYGHEITVVFDGHSQKGSDGSVEMAGPVAVIFSAEGETADQVIERMVGEQGPDADVFVATSDYAEQRMILGRGAHRISARELHMDVEKMMLAFKRFDKRDELSHRYLGQRLDDRTREELEKMRRKK